MPPIRFVPSTRPPTHPGRFRVGTDGGANLGLGGNRGGAFLPDVFGAAGRQIVEAAFGADLAADPGTWTWTDVTTPYVQWDPGVVTQINAGQETLRLVPAKFTATVRNDQAGGGDWTLGNANGRWGSQLRENVPIRHWIDVGGGAVLRFQGYLTGMPPRRGPGGEYFVDLEAQGFSRRHRRRNLKRSPMRRSYDADTVQPVAYWPLEGGEGMLVAYDVISGAPSTVGGFATGVDGKAGVPVFGAADLGDGSEKVANIGGGWNLDLTLPYGTVPTSTAGYEFSMAFGTTTRTGTVHTCGLRFDPASAARHLAWNIYVNDSGLIELKWVEATAAGLTTVAGPTTVYSSGSENIFDGEPRVFQLVLTASGGTNVAWSLYKNDVLLSSGTVTPSFAGAMNAAPWRIFANSTAGADDTVSLGHAAAWTADPGRHRYAPLIGWRSETPTARMARVAAERGFIIDVFGDSDMPMGPQPIGTDADILDDAAKADQGALVDGLGPGYTYITRTETYSHGAALALDATGAPGGDLIGRIQGRDDDQGRVNDFTARNDDGLEAHHVRTDGILGVNEVGTYDRGDTFNLDGLSALELMASWQTGIGTVRGPRWPQLQFELAKASTSAKAQAWLLCLPGSRVDLNGVSTGSNPNRSTALRGWTERTNSKLFTVTGSFFPYDAYEITTLAPDTGGVDEFLGWLEVDSATVVTPIAAGATSVTVTVTGASLTNPSVSTYADDVSGLYVNLDGLRVGVSAITAPAAGRQTLTITGADVTRTVPAGAALTAWQPVVLGL